MLAVRTLGLLVRLGTGGWPPYGKVSSDFLESKNKEEGRKEKKKSSNSEASLDEPLRATRVPNGPTYIRKPFRKLKMPTDKRQVPIWAVR